MLALRAADVGIPRHDWKAVDEDTFALSSHARAREALDFALSIGAPGFNVYVLGDDRTGRMTATVAYLNAICTPERSRRKDWIYLQNFRDPRQPLTFGLAVGDGARFSEALRRYMSRIRSMLVAALESEAHRERIKAIYRIADEQINEKQAALARAAEEVGFTLEESSEGVRLRPTVAETADRERNRYRLSSALDQLEREAGQLRASAEAQALALDRQTLAGLIEAEVAEFAATFADYPALSEWIDDLTEEMLRDVRHLGRPAPDGDRLPAKYCTNLIVDHARTDECVVLEPNPTYENLFGYIEYRRVDGTSETDLMLIRPGALHRANGAVLVLRAEPLAKDETVWTYLKAALRDRAIRIEEPHRSGGMLLSGTPRPQAIPLDAKIVIVGTPDSYYNFFSNDPDFKTYFKVKADIDPDMPATPENRNILGSLIDRMAARQGILCTPEAVSLLLGLSSRLATRRDALSSRFELIEDLLHESGGHVKAGERLKPEAVLTAWRARYRREARAEERFHLSMQRRHVAIATSGAAVGQVNALTIRELGDSHFGRPSRITARASVGHRGLINIERMAELGGRTQQKGALVVEGYLRGTFARRHPISFDCSITFEQSYGSIEGDSASVSELVAIISALSGLPVRQELAVTGSFNQLGEVQAVGDVIEKAEGFFRVTAKERADGVRHGVVIPLANTGDLVVEDDVAAAVADGTFSIWAVDRVEEAVELFLGVPATDAYDRAANTLKAFDDLIKDRLAPDPWHGRTQTALVEPGDPD
ncbi:AAA family ATPase [Dongia deserti]|uniref:AAA family ATPase n=1 Tax=Dongia deserti TaxID=2268030 RepID=UPI000E653D62|nr:ATP-binding protein [Dongia deserti]